MGLGCLCFIFSCSKEIGENTADARVIESDSVMLWIQNSMDKANSPSARKALLKKARELADQRGDDSSKLNYYSKIQWSFLQLDDASEFKETNKIARSIALSLGDSANLARRYWDLAYYFEQKDVNDSAYYNFVQAQKIFTNLNDHLNAGKFLLYMANIQAEVKDYVGSEINAIKAIERLMPLDANELLYDCYNLLGITSKDLKEYDRSIKYYAQAKNYREKLKNKKIFEAQENNNIGVVYKDQGDYEKAIPYFEKALAFDSLALKNPGLYARATTNLAESRYKIDDQVAVLALLKEGLNIRDSIGDIAGLAGSHFILAEYYLLKSDSLQAVNHAQQSKTYAELSDNYDRLLKSLGMLIHLEPSNAATHTHQYFKISDSLQLAERRLRDKFARINFETDEFIAENKSLTKEKQLWAGIAIGALLLGLLVYLVIDQRRKNEKLRFQREQQTANQEIFNLMLSQQQKVEEGKKIEQKRISEELHDGVLGKMLGARMVLTGLNKKADDEALARKKEALELLQKIEGEIRTISHELSHSAYRDMSNFISSIQKLLETTQSVSKIKTSFSHDENVGWDNLSGDIKINLYRILQESLQNAVKHAQCKNVVVNFAAVDDLLDISIIDDGKGFDFKKRKKGIGMRNISSRVKKLGGSWTIKSEIGHGTSLQLKIPLVYHSDELDQILKKEGIKV